MKKHFKLVTWFALILALSLRVSAQENLSFGHLNIVNLIPGDSPSIVRIGGELINADGIRPGSSTGWFLAPTRMKDISISVGSQFQGKGPITITEGVGNVIVIYLQPDKRENEEGQPRPPLLRTRSYSTSESKGLELQFASLCPGENRFKIGPISLEPKSSDVIHLPQWTGGSAEITVNSKSIGHVEEREEVDTYLVLVGTDLKDKYVCVTVSVGSPKEPGWLTQQKREAKNQSGGRSD